MGQVPYRENILVFIFTRQPNVQFLLLKRTPERSGYWQPVCGGIEPNETILDTINRELKEETGIEEYSQLIDLNCTFEYKETKHDILMQMKDFCFAVEVRVPLKIRLSHEHTEYQWIPAEEVSNFFTWDLGLNAFKKLIEVITTE